MDKEKKYLEDDEIDLLEIAKSIWFILKKYRVFILIFTLVGLGAGFIYNAVCPRVYRAQVSFFLPEDKNVGRGLGGVPGYLSFLVPQGSGSKFGRFIETFMESRRLVEMVAKDFINIPEFEKNISKLELQKEQKKISFVVGELQISKNVKLKDKGNIIILSYEHWNPDYLLPVLDSYLKNFNVLNQELGLGVQRNVFRVLDEARKPKSPYKPNKKLNLLFFFAGALLLSSMFVFGYESWQKKIEI